MPFGFNNPVPRSLHSECEKAVNILESFTRADLIGADQSIPEYVLQRAKGLAIITVVKAGFLVSGRAGSGVIVARLQDGSWSPPAAIAMAGGGYGGLIGAEITDFVFILNTEDAVKTFSESGSVTFGGNISAAAGPVGRSAEADAALSVGGLAGIYTYSKSKGLFAGVSLEGSAIVERRDANKKFYGEGATSKSILAGRMRAPHEADPLMRLLRSPMFNFSDPSIYSRYTNYYEYQGGLPQGQYQPPQQGQYQPPQQGQYQPPQQGQYQPPQQAQYQPPEQGQYPPMGTRQSPPAAMPPQQNRPPPLPPSNRRTPMPGAPRAKALYDFAGEQPDDLPFKAGDEIIIVKRTDSENDWWVGQIGDRKGNFPANYVQIVNC